jgi:hypothetical protein
VKQSITDKVDTELKKMFSELGYSVKRWYLYLTWKYFFCIIYIRNEKKEINLWV